MKLPPHMITWLLAGCIAGAALVALFLAYGQPGLLLDQTNLRYCG